MDATHSNLLRLRQTSPTDLDYVVALERDADTDRFIEAWDHSQHARALDETDMAHLIIEAAKTQERLGFVLLAGVDSPHRSVEFKRIVIGPRGHGYGRQAVHLVKEHVFENLRAHRLWLDVKDFNHRARTLYRSEGFVEEGVLRDCVKGPDGYESLVVMSILSSEHEVV